MISPLTQRTFGSILFAPFYIYYHIYERVSLLGLKLRTRNSDKHILPVPYKPTDTKIYIDTRDTGITREILTLSIKEPQNTKTIQSILVRNKVQTVIDIGANIGDFVLLEHQAQPDARLIAIEPVSRNYQVLRRNIEAHELIAHTTVIKAALYEQDEEVTIRVPSQGNWSSLRKSEYTKDADSEQVVGIRFETLFEKNNINRNSLLMRLDIEGYEHDLFTTHREFLNSLSDAWVSIELHLQLLSTEESCTLLESFENAGFKIAHITNDAPYWVSFFHTSFLYPLLIWAYKMRIGSSHIERIEGSVPFKTLKERIKKGAYVYAPHVTFYKP